MKVNNMKLINFRNYKNIDIEFNDKINVFIGKNAQGKTNLIEALYMCSTGNSFRTNRDNEIIMFSKNEAYIGSNVRLGEYNRFIEIKLDKNNPKILRINKTPLKNQKELSSGLNVVVFSPDDLRIIKDGPDNRRKFIDNTISQIKPVYNHNIRKYNKILYQRNNMLKSNKFKKNISEIVDIFDLQIIKIGTNIILERLEYINKMKEISKEIHYKISNELEDLDIEYESNIIKTGENLSRREIESKYYKLLKNSIDRDFKYGTTKIGPHRDDFLTIINDKDARTFGSQGQQRSIVLSLKLSEVEIIKNEKGSYPVLLLDDVYSELDIDRRKYLTSLFSEVQTFITTINSERLDSMKELDKNIYYIEDGDIKKSNKKKI